MAIAMASMVIGFSQASLAAYSGTVALFGTLLYILSFGLGVGPVPALIVPEIAPADIRGAQLRQGSVSMMRLQGRRCRWR